MKTPPLSDKIILQMLYEGGEARKQAWKYMYKTWRVDYSRFILKSGGNQDEVDDALSQVCMEFENRVIATNKPPIENLRGYLVQCVKNKWRKTKKGTPPTARDINDYLNIKDYKPNPEEILIITENKMEFDSLLDKLDRQCNNILKLFVTGYGMREIAQKLQFRDTEQLKKRKYKCLKKLKKIILAGSSRT